MKDKKDILKYLKYFKLIIFSLLSLLFSFYDIFLQNSQLYFFLIQLIQQTFTYKQFCLYFFTYIKDTYFYIYFFHMFYLLL